MRLSRRQLVGGLSATLGMSAITGRAVWGGAQTTFQQAEPWTDVWSRAALEGVLAAYDRRYDPVEHMIGSERGPEYNYQSNLRSMTVHPTRDSLEYGLVLLEARGDSRAQRAFAVIERTLTLQDTDEKSKWFGLWSYYLEEPLSRMAAVDFNWADFNGSTLALTLFRHGTRIPADLKSRMLEALERCCQSIQRRNVTVYYTNIIAQGSFVVLAASQLGAGTKWLDYGRDRLQRWAAVVDESGSFAEYNSSAYTSFLLEIMTRILNYVEDPKALELATKLHDRAWEHFSAHWHVPTKQLAGPMARCYHNDIGQPLWLQKSLNNRLLFERLAEIPIHEGSLAAAILSYRCPPDLEDRFLELKAARLHREMFISGDVLLDTLTPVKKNGDLEPVVGTTWLTPRITLGTANRSDFWVQRRPLLAYWGGPSKTLGWMQLRVIKDDYDFSSALFHSVQQEGDVIGVVGFRNDGGDKHPLIDRINDGAFTIRSMKVEWQFAGWQKSWKMLLDGKAANLEGDVPPASRISIDTGACRIGWQVRWTAFDVQGWEKFLPAMTWAKDGRERVLRLTLYQAPVEQTLKWKDAKAAGCAFTMRISDGVETLAEFDQKMAAMPFTIDVGVNEIRAVTPSLEVTVRHTVGTYPQVEESFHGKIDGKTMPAPRLSDTRIEG